MVCASVSLTILSSTIVANVFSSDLETHKNQNFQMVPPWGVAKLSTSPEVTIFTPPAPYPFISEENYFENYFVLEKLDSRNDF